MIIRIRTYLPNNEMQTPFKIDASDTAKYLEALQVLSDRVIAGELGGFIVERAQQ